ncbi:MAG: ROK family protein [Planctomycetota bacterium]|jgi:predicted NBD/HSP70 family sugar kinase|nr:ROK family protein [Planctomycetota bacterium]
MSGDKKKHNSLKSLKQKNRSDVLDLLRNAAEPLTVAEIASQTSLSKMTVHKIIEFYQEAGLICAAGKRDAGEDGGKRPTLLTINKDHRFIFALKIGEMEIVAALTDLKANIILSENVGINRDARLAEILQRIRELFYRLIGKLNLGAEECAGIVVGCHGITNTTDGIIVTSPHFASWGSNIPIRERVRELFTFPVSVYVDNWIRYFAYAEMKNDYYRDPNFIIIGTEVEGIAAGLVMNGRLISGANGLAGEVGHMIVDIHSDAVCVCGGFGCLEVAISLRRMEKKAWDKRNDWPESSIYGGHSHERRPVFSQVFAAANRGDSFACTLLDEVIDYLALGINNLTQSCDPGLIIIQGEYAKAGQYFIENLRVRLRGLSLLRMNKGIRVEYSEHGDEWTLVGAAKFVIDRYFAALR